MIKLKQKQGGVMKTSNLFYLFWLIFINPIFSQWILQNSNTSVTLYDVVMIDSLTAIAIGDNGTILKTTDAGQNWIQKNSETTNNLRTVSFRNYQNGIAVGSNSIYRTTDGGENWVVTTIDGDLISVSYGVQEFFGIPILIGDNNGKIFYSSDDGNNWNDTIFAEFSPIIAVGVNKYSPSLHTSLIFAVTTQFTVTSYYPPQNWNLYLNPVTTWDYLTGGDLEKEIQYLVGWGGHLVPVAVLLKKINLDTNWVRLDNALPALFTPSDITNTQTVLYTCGGSGKIYKSINEGISWTEQTTGTNSDLNAVSFYDKNIGFAVGNDGLILFTSNGGVTSIKDFEKPESFFISQNYPNPFNPTTTIKYAVPFDSKVKIVVYNVAGELIKELFNSVVTAGSHKIEFDLNGLYLSSGIYFYSIEANAVDRSGSFRDTKKMVFLK